MKEISEVFKQLNINLKKNELNKIMLNFDASGDGSIQFDEFLEVVAA
jgi:Ca2+-binding EF-hand superfamily protein